MERAGRVTKEMVPSIIMSTRGLGYAWAERNLEVIKRGKQEKKDERKSPCRGE
jgi:hypothetical protein